MRSSTHIIQSIKHRLTKSAKPREAVKEYDSNGITQPLLEQETVEVTEEAKNEEQAIDVPPARRERSSSRRTKKGGQAVPKKGDSSATITIIVVTRESTVQYQANSTYGRLLVLN